MKKTIKELAVIIIVFIILNVTGLLTDVVGAVQRVVLFTGIMDTKAERVEDANDAVYDFSLETLDGHTKNFQDLKGKVVFMNLWATWCGPCIAEMPNIQSLYNKIDNNDVVFVMISLDENKDKARKYIKRKEFGFPVYFPKEGIPNIYRTGSIPTTHVISKDGKIIYSRKGTANYDTKRFKKFLIKEAAATEGI